MSIIPVQKNNLPIFLQSVFEVSYIYIFLYVVFQSLNRCTWWKARVTLLKFLQVSIFANFFLMQGAVKEVCELLFRLLQDTQLEVRLITSDTMSGLISCGFIPVDERLLVSVIL